MSYLFRVVFCGAVGRGSAGGTSCLRCSWTLGDGWLLTDWGLSHVTKLELETGKKASFKKEQNQSIQ